MAGQTERRPSMASPLPKESAVDRYMVTDEEFECLQNFDWSCVSAEILNDLEFITKLPTAPVLDYASLGPLLPAKLEDAPAKTLFIDLDETLVHTALGAVDPENQLARHDLSFISDADGSVQARVFFRPWTQDFLRIMSSYYELVLYTASVKLYADIIVDELDPEGLLSHRLYREHCTQYGESEIYFKDLNGTGRDLKESVVLDNRLISFGLNVANGIFVSSFTGQGNDTELLHLLPILVALSKQEDVRIALTETYKLPTIVQRYRQDVHADVARSLANIGSPRAHRIDEFTSLHAQAICTMGSLPTPNGATTTPHKASGESSGSDEELADTASETPGIVAPSLPPALPLRESTCITSSSDDTSGAVSPQSSRQPSSTRHMQALNRISNSRLTEADTGAPLPPATNVRLRSSSSPSSRSRDGSALRRLVLPPPVPPRRRRLSNPFRSSHQIAAVKSFSGRKPVAPKPLY